jgi:2'-5' RNA ligase
VTAPAGVARLFVGLPVPKAVARMLARFAPPAGQGVRPIAASDMHLTLHFLGSMETAPVSESLHAVAAAAFSLRLERLGVFAPRGRRRILWVGVEPAAELLSLHELTATALGAVGYEPERRAYKPHITLARLSGEAAPAVLEAFESQPFGDAGHEFPCRRFALYESVTAPAGARYRIIESFPLGAAARPE